MGSTGEVLDATRGQLPEPRSKASPSGADLSALRSALEEQRDFRQQQLAELAVSDATGDEVTAQLVAGARFALAQIEAALDRMDMGRYGSCVRCGSAITPERLEVLPMAGMCTACQRVHDYAARGSR